jgi:ribonuclease VapC
MKEYVLDSFAILAYCEDEDGALKVAGLLAEAVDRKAEVLACVVNWGESCYITLREGGDDRLAAMLAKLANYPMELVPAGKELTLRAARYKAFHKMSFADAYAAALAATRGAVLVTGDKEFRCLEKEIKILWL